MVIVHCYKSSLFDVSAFFLCCSNNINAIDNVANFAKKVNIEKTSLTIIPTLNLEELNIEAVPAYVENQSYIKIDKESIAGKIGLDFLCKHQAVIAIDN